MPSTLLTWLCFPDFPSKGIAQIVGIAILSGVEVGLVFGGVGRWADVLLPASQNVLDVK